MRGPYNLSRRQSWDGNVPEADFFPVEQSTRRFLSARNRDRNALLRHHVDPNLRNDVVNRIHQMGYSTRTINNAAHLDTPAFSPTALTRRGSLPGSPRARHYRNPSAVANTAANEMTNNLLMLGDIGVEHPALHSANQTFNSQVIGELNRRGEYPPEALRMLISQNLNDRLDADEIPSPMVVGSQTMSRSSSRTLTPRSPRSPVRLVYQPRQNR